VTCLDDIMDCINIGDSNRAVAATAMNGVSSVLKDPCCNFLK